MYKHRPELQRLLRILAYLTKHSDPDGLELYFMIDPQDVKSKHSKPLVDRLDYKKFEGTSDIQHRLGSILQGYSDKLQDPSRAKTFWGRPKTRSANKLSIYVLTNGVWETHSDAKPPIRALVNNLLELQLVNKQVGISFIRFGSDPVGKDRLEELDSGLGLGLYVCPRCLHDSMADCVLSRDIVDTEPSDGNIWKMLLGAVNDTWDKSNG